MRTRTIEQTNECMCAHTSTHTRTRAHTHLSSNTTVTSIYKFLLVREGVQESFVVLLTNGPRVPRSQQYVWCSSPGCHWTRCTSLHRPQGNSRVPSVRSRRCLESVKQTITRFGKTVIADDKLYSRNSLCNTMTFMSFETEKRSLR